MCMNIYWTWTIHYIRLKIGVTNCEVQNKHPVENMKQKYFEQKMHFLDEIYQKLTHEKYFFLQN